MVEKTLKKYLRTFKNGRHLKSVVCLRKSSHYQYPNGNSIIDVLFFFNRHSEIKKKRHNASIGKTSLFSREKRGFR